MRTRFIALTLALLSTLALASQEAVTLKRTVKIGDTYSYDFLAVGKFGDSDGRYRSVYTERVVEVNSDGSYAVEIAHTDGKQDADTSAEKAAPPSTPRVVAFSAMGEVIEFRGGKVDATTVRNSNLLSVRLPDKPVKPGDTWEVALKADAKTGAVALKGVYTVEAAEKLGERETLKVKFDLKEQDVPSPATAVGTVWFDLKDGAFVNMNISCKGVMLGVNIGPLDIDYFFTRKEPAKPMSPG